MTTYLLDTNIFIQAKNLHYGFEFCPAFWDWLDQQNEAGKVFSTEKVSDEIQVADDELANWTRQRPKLFLAPNNRIKPSLTALSIWANSQSYQQAGVSTFLQSTDYYLVAQAHANDCIVVTHEASSESLRKIKIPKACRGVGVTFTNPYEMLREEKARFVLEQ